MSPISFGQDLEKIAPDTAEKQLDEAPKEPKKANSISVPDALPATGIRSVLGEQANRPDAVYLRRENGDSVFVPQLRYEEFERYLNQQTSQTPSDLPVAVFEAISATGEIRDGFAQLKIDCKVTITDAAKKVVEIELGLSNCNIQRVPKTVGGQKSLLYPNKNGANTNNLKKNGDGFIWAIQPDGSNFYSIQIDALVKLDRVGLDSSLRFELPSGPTRIELKIPSNANRPAANLQWSGNSGEVLQSTDQPPFVKANITGRGGSGLLTWNEGLEQPSLGVIEAESDTRFLLNRQSLRWDVASKIRLRSTGRRGPQDIIFELPENAVWIPSQTPGLQTMWTLGNAPLISDETSQVPVAPNSGTASSGTASTGPTVDQKKTPEAHSPQRSLSKGKRQRLLLRLSERARGFTDEIPIEWRLPISDKSEQAVTISSPMILDAQRHEGRISVRVPSDQQFSWTSTNELQFLNQDLAQDNNEYEFRFARQGGLLDAILRTDQAQVRLKSIYLATITTDEIQLNGVYQFTQPPASLQELTFEAPGWTLHGLSWVDTADLIPADSVKESSLRVVPGSLSSSVASISGPESKSIRLLATRPVSVENGTPMSITLPLVRWLKSNREQVQERGDGWLYISPGPFKATSEPAKLTAMTRTNDGFENFQSYFQLPSPIDTPLAYRFRSGSNSARWESPLKLTPRVVAGVADTDIIARENNWTVNRRWKLNIEGPYLNKIAFRVADLDTQVSKDAIDASDSPTTTLNWDLLLNDIPIAVTTRPDSSAPGFYFIEADMIEAFREADVQLSCTHVDARKVPSDGSDSQTSWLRKYPIAELQIDSQSTVLDKAPVLKIEGDILCEVKDANGNLLQITSFDGPVPLPHFDSNVILEMQCQDLKTVALPSFAIDRIWLQTLSNKSQVRQRVVMKVETIERSVAFKLPKIWDPQTLKVVIDGVEVPSLLTSSGEATPAVDSFWCPLDSKKTDTPSKHVIEFWNWHSLPSGFATKVEPLIPHIEGASPTVSCAWQIAVPSEEVLWSFPSSWIADWNWTISDWRMKRVAAQNQLEFERDFNASRQPPLPQSTNQYVLTSIVKNGTTNQDASTGSVVVIPRVWIWLPIGSTVIAISILWSLSTWFRRPLIWVAFGVVLILLASIAPDGAILVGQTAVVSLMLIAIIHLCRWAWPVRSKRRDPGTGSYKTTGSTIINPIAKSANEIAPEIRAGSQPTQLSPVENDGVTAKSPAVRRSFEPESILLSTGSASGQQSGGAKPEAIASTMRTEAHRSGSHRSESLE
ncbi:MAG: hypothetical protein NTW52_07160 [Planctomycetota bacterium]|nr:hypothetical protein [Planctomycetota bacterium]